MRKVIRTAINDSRRWKADEIDQSYNQNVRPGFLKLASGRASKMIDLPKTAIDALLLVLFPEPSPGAALFYMPQTYMRV